MYPTARQIMARPWIRIWLFIMALLVFAMVIVGGATRLTDSGLSITEWKPLLGVIPPLNDEDWQAAFALYKQIPEYKLINRGMSLDEFKFIYWWEWAHRFLGRFIGLAFFVPMAFFWFTGRLEAGLKPKLVALFVLGGLQGVLGWYMVMSGLSERTDVSQYRLAAHLTLAAIIFAGLIWTALGIGSKRQSLSSGPLFWAVVTLVVLIVVQIFAGGLVAGLDAGQGYRTWPLMAGAFIPEGLSAMSPTWINSFENALTVQFQHRMLAYGIFTYAVLIIAICWSNMTLRRAGIFLAGALLVQMVLGVWTLLAGVPISLGLLHQGGALVVLTISLWLAHLLATPQEKAA